MKGSLLSETRCVWDISQIVATHASSHIDCSSNLVVWPLVALYSMMGTLLVCYALCPVAAPSQHKLIYQFALWPKIVQVVLVLFSGASLAIVVMSQEAYGCTNHRWVAWHLQF